MLTSGTKKHIDNARQVLVGVVPNPTAQIEQITNALIYKFMDDMDQASIKAGGDPSFFVRDLEKYSWSRIMDSRIGNQERMNLYSEALVKFSQAKQLPELFRSIFKSAFLSYRSPETLGLFLKEIDYFDYSHSEELGNAYEYLLSIMSSQGDAGQFRTPRHIIDFIVDVVDPTKDDKVLDPACGTGGFLISSYKHILEQHDNKEGSKKKKKPLTPDDKKRLMSNFEGYYIDPTMERIAQVNMYLHQFKNPKIFQYDCLSNDERWKDKFDVILANPPFMSPKGGISPHNKFSIQSTRSEVLFVDYIMNHLRPNGRAGIIVPEGIIFQSGNTYKQLRKNLIEDGLYAVVSLPSGVFAPYSGVKTSILLFNNELAKQRSEILFIKVENDGFDLGAQRRSISKNDLPTALSILKKWSIGEKSENKMAAYIERAKISENGDYNLSGDRYRVTNDYSKVKWPMVELGEVCSFEYGKPLKKEDRQNGLYPVFGSNGIVGYHNEYLVKGPFIIVGRKGSAGAVTYSEIDGYPIDTTFFVRLIDKNLVCLKFLYSILQNIGLERINTQAGVPGLNRNDTYKIKIPLPPLEIQEQIVRELNSYSAIITGAKQIISNWRPEIDIDQSWKIVKFEDVCEINPKKSEVRNLKSDIDVSFVPMSDLSQNDSVFKPQQMKKLSEVLDGYTYFADNDVLLAQVTPCFENGKAGIAKSLKNGIGFGSSEYIVLRPSEKILPEIIYTFVTTNTFNNEGKLRMTGTGGLQRVPVEFIKNYKIHLPPLSVQKEIVEKIEAERLLVESSKKLISIYEQKIKELVSKLWSE